MWFGLATPVLAVLVAGAIDLASLLSDRSAIQDVVDAAAIQAAQQSSVSEAAALGERSKHFVDEQLAKRKIRLNYAVNTAVAKDGSVTITVSGKRTSFFGNMLPPGGWPINQDATASPMGRVPLCVLTSGKDDANRLDMKGNAHITAAGCLVHANADIAVESTAWLKAALIQASGLAAGRITPTAQQSAPLIEDPFKSMTIKTPASLCLPLDVILSIGLNTLPPGVHCGKYIAGKGATLRLQPGEHYFSGKLELKENGILQGDDVVLVFDKDSDFKFSGSSQIDLTGRKKGAFAGFVLATTRNNTRTFEISSDNARELLGTIYIPAATLKVTGAGNDIADQSAWTVVVAKEIKMEGSPNLVINSNYSVGGVPVPTGVGPTTQGSRLTN